MIRKLMAALLLPRHLNTKIPFREKLMETDALICTQPSPKDGSKKKKLRQWLILNLKKAKMSASLNLKSMIHLHWKPSMKIKILIKFAV
jgi:hypothetical protein